MFAVDNGTPLIIQYLSHPFSAEGHNLRGFSQQMRLEIDAQELRQIPKYLEEQRDLLVARLKNRTQAYAPVAEAADLSPGDSLRHTREGASALFATLSDTQNPVTTEQIDLGCEQYFFSLIGSHVFDVFREREADAAVARKCALFADVRPEQFNVPPKLCENPGHVFRRSIERLIDFATNCQTPTTKLVAAYRAVESLLQEINDATGIRAGVDDFTDPLQFCCLKANIPDAISQIRFVSAMTRRRVMHSAFWSHFVALQLVVEHILALEITPELSSAVGSGSNLSPYMSVTRSRFNTTRGPAARLRVSTFDSDEALGSDLPLIADIFPQLPNGIASLSDPFPVVGFRAFVVVSRLYRPSYPFSTLLIETGDQADVVMLRSLVVSGDLAGVRLAASLAHPRDIDLVPVQTRDGVVNTTTLEKVPRDLSLIPIESGNLLDELDVVKLKAKFLIVSGLDGSESLERLHRATEDLYEIQCHDPNRLLGIIAGRVCGCLTKLGLLTKNHPGDEIDWAVLAGLASFQQRLADAGSQPCDRLSPGLLRALEEYTKDWEAALITPAFGYDGDAQPELWQFTTSLIQAYAGISITGFMDEATRKSARRVIRWVLDHGLANPVRSVLAKCL
jgi:hypothetical protein